MAGKKAHNLTDQPRTQDVLIQDNISFNDFLLSERTLKGLEAHGFKKPSPIQRKAIPLGRCGFDMIVQAKSGTGKTCVFTVIALEMLDTDSKALQVLILSPTREISVQIKDALYSQFVKNITGKGPEILATIFSMLAENIADPNLVFTLKNKICIVTETYATLLQSVISAIGQNIKDLKVEAFIGGTSFEGDKKKLQNCQVAVGAPGRVRHLISDGIMNLDFLRLFVLDEADKLMEDNFRKDISFIFLKLPQTKQMIAASATFPPELEDFVVRYMANPMRVSPGKETFLVGIRQFITVVPSHPSILIQIKNKVAELVKILSSVPFKQCLVFSNYQSRAESICNILNKEGWPAVHISGSQNQNLRLKALSSLKAFQCRVLLSTDLTSRGIDAENVNLVINLDLPYDGTTYMHRIGRAGRYGTYGLAITIVQSGLELEQFRKMMYELGGGDFKICLLPKANLSFDIWKAEDGDLEKIFSLEGEYKYSKTRDCEIDKLAKEKQVHKEHEDKIVDKALKKLLSSQLVALDKPQLDEWHQLVNKFPPALCSEDASSNAGTLEEESELHGSKQKLCYADFLPEEKLPVIVLENQILKGSDDPEQKMEPETQNRKTWKVENDASRKRIESEESKNEEESTISETTEVEDSECESEGGKLWDSRESLHIKQWYSMWYAQLSAIRQYVYYLKHFNYWKFMTERQ